MNFLKDKKNLPIVIGLAVAVLVGAGGLIALELGLFSGGGSPTPAPPSTMGRGGPTPPGAGNPPSPQHPVMAPPSAPPPTIMARRGPAAPAKPGAPAVAGPPPPAVVDPTKGPDPFGIPGGIKRVASVGGVPKGTKLPLNQILPPFNLFKVQPPPPPLVLAPPPGAASASGPPSNVRLVGIVNAADGINAILEVNGQSQTVKPGDSLQDGSRVTNIQDTSITLSSAGGVTSTIALTGGAGGADASGNGQDPNAGGPSFGQPPNQP